MESGPEWTVNTHNRKLACFRSFGRFLGWQDFLGKYKRPPSEPGQPHPLRGGYTDVLKVIWSCRKTTHRAAAVLTGLCGLRISEACIIKMRHLNLDTMTLTVYGKGNKTRHVPISDRAWLELLPRVIEVWGTEERLVPIHERNARAGLTRAGARVGIDLASHDMRMTFGTETFRKSNIRVTQRLLGHSSVETTQLYTGVDEDEERAAVDFDEGDE